MKFCWVTINVKDMEKSLAFYQDVVGLKINRRMQTAPGHELAFLGSEGTSTEVELIRNEKNDNPQYGNDISIGFEVASLEQTIDMLKSKGVPVNAGPFSPNPRVKFLYVLDPNGVRVQFVENVR